LTFARKLSNQQSNLLAPEERMSWEEYREKVLKKQVDHVLLDVRAKEISERNKIQEESINIPVSELIDPEKDGLSRLKQFIEEYKPKEIVAYCNRGISSQTAVKYLKSVLDDPSIEVRDIIGGYEAYKP